MTPLLHVAGGGNRDIGVMVTLLEAIRRKKC